MVANIGQYSFNIVVQEVIKSGIPFQAHFTSDDVWSVVTRYCGERHAISASQGCGIVAHHGRVKVGGFENELHLARWATGNAL